jgi:hypothetical protein
MEYSPFTEGPWIRGRSYDDSDADSMCVSSPDRRSDYDTDPCDSWEFPLDQLTPGPAEDCGSCPPTPSQSSEDGGDCEEDSECRLETTPIDFGFKALGECSVPGCHSPVLCKHLCRPHYARARRTIRKREGCSVACSEEGCTNLRWSGKRCKTHHRELGPIPKSPPRGSGKCSARDCGRPLHNKTLSLCRMHYNRVHYRRAKESKRCGIR